MNQNVYLVSVADEGKRLDQFLKERTGLTRSEVQKWIEGGECKFTAEEDDSFELSCI